MSLTIFLASVLVLLWCVLYFQCFVGMIRALIPVTTGPTMKELTETGEALLPTHSPTGFAYHTQYQVLRGKEECGKAEVVRMVDTVLQRFAPAPPPLSDLPPPSQITPQQPTTRISL